MTRSKTSKLVFVKVSKVPISIIYSGEPFKGVTKIEPSSELKQDKSVDVMSTDKKKLLIQ